MMLWSGLVLLAFGLFWLFNGSSAYLSSARAGGDYLTAHQYDDGSFEYEYDPVTGNTSSSYNILRHAGTAFSLLQLYKATGETRYLEAAESALAYLEKQLVPCPVVRDALCVEEGNEIKLGGNALAILALTQYNAVAPEQNAKYLELAQQLAHFLVGVQSPSGEFTVHKIDMNTGARAAFESEYYPGEALFALSRLYALDGDEAWIDAAHRGARWLIEVRDKNIPTAQLIHDHWLLYALNELHENRPDELLYVAHAKRIVESILATQHTDKTGEQKTWNGGFYNPPRSTPTATRNEGLGAAYELFTRSGDLAYTTVMLPAMKNAAAFQMQTQFTPRKIRALHADKSGLGGFHESLDDYTVRIDYVQHNISALLLLDSIDR